MNRFVPYSYKDNIARTYYGTVNISYEPALFNFDKQKSESDRTKYYLDLTDWSKWSKNKRWKNI